MFFQAIVSKHEHRLYKYVVLVIIHTSTCKITQFIVTGPASFKEVERELKQSQGEDDI